MALAAIAAVAWLMVSSWAGRAFRSAPGGPAASGSSAKPMRQPAPLVPAVGLWVNSSGRVDVRQGTPLVLSIRLANHQAMNALLANAARQQYLVSIDERAQRGALSAEQAAAMRAAVEPEATVRSIEIGGANRDWTSFVRFELSGPSAPALPWSLRPSTPIESDLRLDARTTAEARFVLSPEAAAAVAPGEYRVAVVIEVPSEAGTTGSWRGSARSAPVTIRILPASSAQDATAESHEARLRAEYFAEIGDWKQSLTHAEEAIARVPASVDAHILVGEARKAMGDRDGALAAYWEALRRDEEQHSGPPDEPSYIADQISVLSRPRRQ